MANNSTKPTFKKDDFLNAIQLVEKLNRPAEEIHKAMIHEYKNNSQIRVGNIYYPVVIRNRDCHVQLSNPKRLLLHPLGLPKLKEILEKGK